MDATRPPSAIDVPGTLRARFGDFTIDARQRRLERDGTALELAPKQFDALLLLVANAGNLVTKEQFAAALWANTIVSDSSLNKYIWQLRRVLGERADESRFIETVPKQGYRFVATVQRLTSPQNTTDLVPHQAVPASIAAPASRKPSLFRPILYAALAVAFVAIAVWQWPTRAPVVSASSSSTHTLAVLPPANLHPSPENEWLATAIAELGSAQFHGLTGVRVIPLDVLRDFGISPIRQARADSAESATVNTAADWVMRISFLELAPTGMPADIRIETAILDAHSGATLAHATRSGRETDLVELVGSAGAELRSRLGLFDAREAAYSQNASIVPADPKAAKAYAQGLDALRSFDAPNAAVHLQETTALSADFAPAYAALAQAWNLMGYDGRARESARNAVELSEKLPREQRLLYTAQADEYRSDWPKAITGYQALSTFVNDNPEYALKLAVAQTRAGRHADVAKTLDQLLHDVPAESDDPRVMIVRARALYSQSEFPDALTQAQSAEKIANRLNAPLLAAEANLHAGWCLFNLGRLDEAAKTYQASFDSFTQSGNSIAASRAMSQMVQMRIGNNAAFDTARPAIETLLEQTRAAGYKRGEAQATFMLANLLWVGHKRAEGLAATRQMLALFHELGDRNGEARARTMLGNFESSTENFADADEQFKSAEELFGAEGNHDDLSWTLSMHGDSTRMRGDFPRAATLLQAATDAAEAGGNPASIAYTAYFRSILALDRNALAEGDAQLAIARTNSQASPQDHLALFSGVQAELALAHGHANDAMTAIEEGSKISASKRGGDASAWFTAVRARVAIEQKDRANAMRLIENASKNLPDEDDTTGMTARLYLAEDYWILANRPAAIALWHSVQKNADRVGMQVPRMEAAIGLACSDPAELTKAVDFAKARGFLRGVAWADRYCGKNARLADNP